MAKSKSTVKNILLDNWILLAVLLLLGIVGSFYINKEGFDNISKFIKDFPSPVNMDPNNDLLLAGWYPAYKPNPIFSDETEQVQYRNYPAFSANFPYSNNILKWRSPSNGTCIPAGVCGNFYGDKPVKYKNEPCKPPMYSETNPRVNFYLSST